MVIKVCSEKELEITGNIKSVLDYQEIKDVISDMLRSGGDELIVTIKDSVSITSSVIGLFLKIVFKDGVKLILRAGDDRLVNLIKDLKLSAPFNLQKYS